MPLLTLRVFYSAKLQLHIDLLSKISFPFFFNEFIQWAVLMFIC